MSDNDARGFRGAATDRPLVSLSTHSEDCMTTEADFHQEMLSLYRRTGMATGYWPNYFLGAVR